MEMAYNAQWPHDLLTVLASKSKKCVVCDETDARDIRIIPLRLACDIDDKQYVASVSKGEKLLSLCLVLKRNCLRIIGPRVLPNKTRGA